MAAGSLATDHGEQAPRNPELISHGPIHRASEEYLPASRGDGVRGSLDCGIGQGSRPCVGSAAGGRTDPGAADLPADMAQTRGPSASGGQYAGPCARRAGGHPATQDQQGFGPLPGDHGSESGTPLHDLPLFSQELGYHPGRCGLQGGRDLHAGGGCDQSHGVLHPVCPGSVMGTPTIRRPELGCATAHPREIRRTDRAMIDPGQCCRTMAGGIKSSGPKPFRRELLTRTP